jgi:hypothetical protein
MVFGVLQQDFDTSAGLQPEEASFQTREDA